jgi:hypothetical protein
MILHAGIYYPEGYNHKTNAYNDCYEAVPKRPHGLERMSELNLFRIPARRQCYLVDIAETSCPLNHASESL